MIQRYSLFISVLVALIAGCAAPPPVVQHKKQAYAFWPPAPDEPRIQFLTTINSSEDVSDSSRGRFENMLYGAEPVSSLAVQKPYGVRLSNGCLYICEIRAGGVTVFDLVKQQTRVMGSKGAGTIKKAVDIAIAPEGTKYVIDQPECAIKVFNAAERYVTSYSLPNTQLNGACVFGPYLYVTDSKNSRVMILDRNYGKVLKVFGERGGLDGQFILPLAIAADKQGCVYVSDLIRAKVQKFGPDGAFLMSFGDHGEHPGQFMKPKHLAVGSDGHIHVVDAEFNNVQVFDPQGRFVGYYGSRGKHAGAMDLPAGLDLAEQNLEIFAKYVHPAFQMERIIIVSNQFGDRKLNVYAMGSLKQGKTVADLGGRETVATGLLSTTQPTAAPAPGAVTAAQVQPATNTQPTSRFATQP